MGNMCLGLKNPLEAILQSLPQLSENTLILWESMINIVLVYIGGRSCYLLESSKFKNNGYEWETIYKMLRQHIHDLGLNIQYDPFSVDKFPRFIIAQKEIPVEKPFSDFSILHDIDNKSVMNTHMKIFCIYADTHKNFSLPICTQFIHTDHYSHIYRKRIENIMLGWQLLWDRHTNRYNGITFHLLIYD